MASDSWLQQRSQRRDQEGGMSAQLLPIGIEETTGCNLILKKQMWDVPLRPLLVNCWGGGAEVLGARSAAAIAAAAAAEAAACKLSSVEASQGTSEKSQPDVGQ